MDLKTGKVIQSILENASDGVFTIHADFTQVQTNLAVLNIFVFCIVFQCGRYILYYHNSRRSIRLFTRNDGKLVANYCLHTEATAFMCTEDGNR